MWPFRGIRFLFNEVGVHGLPWRLSGEPSEVMCSKCLWCFAEPGGMFPVAQPPCVSSASFLSVPSLSSSMQSLSSGSSPGSLTSSRGSLAASSLDSSTSASFTDLYYDPFEQLDSELQSKVEFLLLEGATGFRPSGCITTIHEDEVAKTQKTEGGGRLQALRSLSGTPKSMTSLSPRSSLSSPSPPCSPLIADPLLAGDAFLSPLEFEDPELSAALCELSLGSSSREKYQLEEPGTEDKPLGQGRERHPRRVGTPRRAEGGLCPGLNSGPRDPYGHH